MALALVRWFEPVLDLVFPVVCPVCLTRSDDPAHRPFCGPCWAALPVGLGPGCPVCGEPFPGLGGTLPCDACRRSPPPYAFARAVAEYRDGMREAIHALKFGGRPVLATPLGRLLAEAGARALPVPPGDWVEGLVPVPLHPARLAERGFNQAELLAAPCARPVACAPSSRAPWSARARPVPRPTSTRRPGVPTSATRSGSAGRAAVEGPARPARGRRSHDRRDRRRRGPRAPGGGRGRGRRPDPRPRRPALRPAGAARRTARAR